MSVSLYDLSYEECQTALKELGEKPFHAKQIFKWLYEKRVDSIDEMSDLSLSLRETLKEKYPLRMPSVRTKQESSDGTIKYLFELEDGSLIESVLMVFDYGYSACLTTQVGCNMGCAFCASGLLKKQRDLTAGEIITQALFIQKQS